MTRSTTTPVPAQADIDSAIADLTKLGRTLMEGIGRGRFSFFDDGVVEGSGIWGEILGGEFGETKNIGGVIGRLVKAGLLLSQETGEQGGSWVTLTALGAAVANQLTEDAAPAPVKPKRARGSKQSYTIDPATGEFGPIQEAPAPAPAKAKAPKAPARDRDAAAEARVAALPEELRNQILAAVPAGYAVIWPRASWSTLKATSEAPADASRWLILCNSHGTTKDLPGAVGREFGKADIRPTWCPGCAKDAKAKAKAEVSAARTGTKVTTARLINTGKPVDGRETAARKRAAK
jgi:hypothetical protein